MKNILKFGLMSAVTAVALAQTPATTQSWEEDDVLAIASRGALSDSMQGFRKLADDEAGSIFGGLNYYAHFQYFREDRDEYGYQDRYGFIASYYADYRLGTSSSENASGRLNIGAGDSYSDYNSFNNLVRAAGGELYLRVKIDYTTNRFTQQLVNRWKQPISNTAFTNRLTSFIRSYYINQFSNYREDYFRRHYGRSF